MSRYILHIANKNYSSWSLRPWVMMRSAGTRFEERLHAFTPDGSSRERFLAFSPTGQVPCLYDGDTVIWDSLAILEYLAEREPGYWPQESGARAWARCASAEMHSGFSALRSQCSMSVGHRMRLGRLAPTLKADLARLDQLWCDGLARFGGPFLAGANFTSVDAMYAPVAFRIQTYGLELSEPALGYARRLLDLPAMRDWAGAALAETFREPAHDREIEAAGELIADLRATPR